MRKIEVRGNESRVSVGKALRHRWQIALIAAALALAASAVAISLSWFN